MSEDRHEEDRLEEVPQDELEPVSGPLQIESTPDDRNMGMLAHILGFTLVGPLIIWLTKKDQSKFVDDQGKEALNLDILMFICHAALTPLMCVPFVNILALLCHVGLRITHIVFGIIGGMQAKDGKVYRYPINLRLLK